MARVEGTVGGDILFSERNDDTEVLGFLGDDILLAASGNDTLDGGEGRDQIRFGTTFDGIPFFQEGVTASLTSGTASGVVDGTDYTYTLLNFEDLWGSSAADQLFGDENDNEMQGLLGDDLLAGLGGNDLIFSGGGDDTVLGGDGNDNIFGSDGNGVLDGGDGTDWVLFSTTTGGQPIFNGGVIANLSTGEGTGQAGQDSYSYTLRNFENLRGSNFDDVLTGDDGDNEIQGFDGSDIIKGGAGDDVIRGGIGTDVALYDGASTHFTLQYRASNMETFVVDRTGAEGTDIGGTNIMRFSDRDFNAVADGQEFFTDSNISQEEYLSLVELYIAYFNRAPDAEGLAFWTIAFINGTSLDQAADFFFDQPETRALYGDNIDTATFVSAVYQNVLGRGPDETGQAFWTNAIDNGGVSQGQFIRDFLQGTRADAPADATPEFRTQQTADQAFLDTKTDIGVNFGTILGMSNVANATAVMGLYDGTDASLAAVQTATNDAYQAALATDGTGELLIQIVGLIPDPFAA